MPDYERDCDKCCERNYDKCCENDCDKCREKKYEKKQTHVHEFLGSTQLAEFGEERHNHRFAGVSGQAIYVPCGHFHEIEARTDFLDHFHLFKAKSSLQIPVGEGKHVHFVEAITNEVDEHVHELEFATLIEAPTHNND
jgi:hypothetical protein